ncbi:MAG: TetR/AcrR family transcriptional regulator [Spirochaetota bacterium]
MLTKRQRDILDASVAIAAEKGLTKLTIRNVAAAVGITEPAVYRHFSSKLDLLQAILEDLQATIQPHFSILSEMQHSEAQGLLNRFLRGLYGELDAKPAYAVFIFSEELFHLEPKLKGLLGFIIQENLTYVARLFEFLQQQKVCRDDIPAKQLAEVCLGVVRFEIAQWHLSGATYSLASRSSQTAETLSNLFS